MLNSWGARTNPCGTPLLRRRNLLLWPFPVVRVKLRLPTISMIMWTMCLSGSNRSSLQVSPRCHPVSYAAVRSTNTVPAFFSAEKLPSMSCVNRVTNGDSKGGPGWAMAPPDFCLPPAWPPQFFRNFPFKFIWLTYTVDNFRPAIF